MRMTLVLDVFERELLLGLLEGAYPAARAELLAAAKFRNRGMVSNITYALEKWRGIMEKLDGERIREGGMRVRETSDTG